MRIGIDLGGTKIEGIILNSDGEIQHKIRLDTPVGDYGEVVESICRITEKLQGDCNMTVGIGTPGVLDAQTSLMKNSNSLCIDGKPFKRDVESRLGYEIKVENDANCSAWAEHQIGAGVGVDNLLVVCSILVSPINDDNPLPNPFLILFTKRHSLYVFLDL